MTVDSRQQLETIGVGSIDDLFATIPAEFRLQSWDLPAGISEMAVRDKLRTISEKNTTDTICFMGGGYYDHYIPSAIDALTSRSEFYTAYTPYQPECAQGTLQSIYEYQSAISLKPKLVEAYYNLGVFYEFYRKDTGRALTQYQKYVQLGGNDERVKKLLKKTSQ